MGYEGQIRFNPKGDPKAEAKDVIREAMAVVNTLPRFKGQAQIVESLRRTLRLAVWSK